MRKHAGEGTALMVAFPWARRVERSDRDDLPGRACTGGLTPRRSGIIALASYTHSPPPTQIHPAHAAG